MDVEQPESLAKSSTRNIYLGRIECKAIPRGKKNHSLYLWDGKILSWEAVTENKFGFGA